MREDQLYYVSGRTKKRLFWILELEKQSQPQMESNHSKILTVDEIADRALNEWIESKYPNMKVLEKRLDALKGQLIGELLNPTVEK